MQGKKVYMWLPHGVGRQRRRRMHVELLTWADVLVQQMPQGKLAGLWQAFSCGIYGGQSLEHL
jgi:hypothetical protein